jgi:glycosyltransferase involved in cell wall biosynthesis
MRIALLSWESKHSISVGGLAEHVTELGAALTRFGHEVHAFTRIAPGQTGYTMVDGVHYHRCPYEPHPDFLADNQRMCDSLVWHLAETESFLGARFDLIHGHDWLVVRAMEQAKHLHGRPLVMTFHSTEFGRCGNRLFEGASRQIRDLEWQGSFLSAHVICVSKSLQREVQGLYSVPGDKMSAIYNGIDVSRFDLRMDKRAARREIQVGMDDPMVLFAGRLTWQKGPDLLMNALPDLLSGHPDTKFVFAGDGDMRGSLRDRAERLGVASATRFVGKLGGRDLVGLFKCADLVCVPSRNEPFGIVILEAWGARKPVVATRNGGPGEFVTHERTGLTVSDRSESIQWGVDRVLGDKAEGTRLGRNGRREAESFFSWDTIGEQTIDVYQSVLGESTVGTG